MLAYDCLVKSPARIVFVGSSGSGKTWLACHILENFEKVFARPLKRIYIFYQHEQQMYVDLQKKCKIPVELKKGLPSDSFRPRPKSLILLDDFMELDSPIIRSWFLRRSHHYDSDCIYLTQNLFPKGRISRDVSLNANYICIFRARRDFSQLEKLNYQLLGAQNRQFLQKVYKYLTKNRPYSYLFIDLQTLTPDEFRFRSSIIPEKGVTRVCIPQTS